MATATDATKDIQSLMDPRAYSNVARNFSGMGITMTQVMLDAAQRSTDILSQTAQETFDNLREVTTAREEPSEMGRAYTDFVQKQMHLAQRTLQEMMELGQHAAREGAEAATQAGEEAAEKAQDNAKAATSRATSAAKKASDAA